MSSMPVTADELLARWGLDDPREPGDGDVGSQGGASKRPPIADVLLGLARGMWRLGQAEDGEPFAVPLSGPRLVLPLRGGRVSLRAALAATHVDAQGVAPSQQGLADTMLALEGLAARETPETLHLRVAERDHALWLDLGDETGEAVRISADGWRCDQPPVLFRRTALTAALPRPERGGTFGDLWGLLNVKAADRPLLAAWLVANLMPGVPHPVLALTGEQGTGKSSAATAVTALVDPSPAQLRKPPKDSEAWVTAASGSWVVGVDNVSYIDPDWSDALCRAVTGDGDVRRRLYTDGQLAVWSFRRCVVLTGIDLGALRGDLTERLLTVDLDKIDPADRLLDRDLSTRWRTLHPRVLGALLDLAAQVLRVLPDVHLDELPRMADFALVLAAVDRVLGTDGLARYAGLAERLAVEAVSGDAVLAAIAETIKVPWVGGTGALAELLGPHPEAGRAWPSNARALGARLKRGATMLRASGWTVEDLGLDRHGSRLWRLAPPVEDRAGHAPEERRIAPGAGPLSGDPAPYPAPETVPLTCEDAGTPDTPDRGPTHSVSAVRQEGPPASREGVSARPGSSGDPALGPCTRCGATCRRYGDAGSAWCQACRDGADAAPPTKTSRADARAGGPEVPARDRTDPGRAK